MKILKISIESLFGTLDHEVSLNNAGLTFIHGPNGCGKTTVLRLVHAFMSADFQYLKTVDFKKLSLSYEDGCSLVAVRTVSSGEETFLFEEERVQSTIIGLSISLVNSLGKDLHKFDYTKHMQKESRGGLRFGLSAIEKKLPFLSRLGPHQWVDVRTNVRYSFDEIVSMYGDRLNFYGFQNIPSWLQERVKKGGVEIIKTQRLIDLTPSKKSSGFDGAAGYMDVVDVYSSSITDIIRKKLAESAIKSQAQDRSFPMRLINKDFKKDVKQVDFLETYRATEERAQNLMLAGLLDQAENIPLPQRDLTEFERDVLSLYLSDFNEKLDAFADLQKRIETLVDIVGPKLRRKKFHINRQKGFIFETTEPTPRRLSPSDLSSGEQHQIVLFYELIFSSAGVDLFLIDEPEISLHVEWQRSFISDIEKVQRLTGASFLVATHSPQIINNRRDLAIPLDGGVPE